MKSQLRNIDSNLDALILDLKQQIELKIGKDVTYPFVTKIIADVLKEKIYLRNVEISKHKRKNKRNMIFEVEINEKE